MTTIIFDSTALSHFARASQLETLAAITHQFRCVTMDIVMGEIADGVAEHPALARVANAEWFEILELETIDEVVAFARYKTELGGVPNRNNGEAAVLAWASVNDGIAIIDESVATRIARRDGVAVHGTLWLVVNGMRAGMISEAAAELIIDGLAATDMRLPTNGAGFLTWARNEGLLP